jgi:DNA-binding LytR/AlgR family response regulator
MDHYSTASMIDNNDPQGSGQAGADGGDVPGRQGTGGPGRGQRFSVPIAAGKAILQPAQVLRLEADGSYTRIHCVNGSKLTVCRSMGELHAQLPQARFIRLHHTHVVNVDHVVSLLASDGHRAVLSNGESVPISRRRWKHVVTMVEAGEE